MSIRAMIADADMLTSEAVELILGDHAAERDLTRKSILAAIAQIGRVVGHLAPAPTHTSPRAMGIAVMSVEAAIKHGVGELGALVSRLPNLALDDGDILAALENGYEFVDYLTGNAYILQALYHYQQAWGCGEFNDCVPDMETQLANFERYKKLTDSFRQAAVEFEAAIRNDPTAMKAIREVAIASDDLADFAADWPTKAVRLPWWLNQEELQKEPPEE